MVDLTILEVHLDLNASDLPFGETLTADERATALESGDWRRRSTSVRSGGGIGEKIPTRLLAGVAVLALVIGAVVAAKRFDRDTVDDLTGPF